MNLLCTLGIGASCGYFFYKKHIPAGLMIGAILGTAIFQVLTGNARVPEEMRFLSQVISGAAIGFAFSREDLKKLPTLLKPLGLLLGGLITANFAIGFLVYRLSSLDIVTSLICCLPGALSTAPIIAAEMGGNMAQVAFLQFIRMSLSIIAFPVLVRLIDRNREDTAAKSNSGQRTEKETSPKAKINMGQYLFMLIIAVCGGLIGKRLGISGGSIVGAMTLTMICKLCMPQLSFPVMIKKIAQVLAGIYIGSHISIQDIKSVPLLLIPMLLIIGGYFIYWLFLGLAMQKIFKFEKRAAFLSVIPAGGGDIALIAADLGVENTDLLVMQVFRMIVVTGFFPEIIRFVANSVF